MAEPTVEPTKHPEMLYFGLLTQVLSEKSIEAIRMSGHSFYDSRGDARVSVIVQSEILKELKTMNASLAMLNLTIATLIPRPAEVPIGQKVATPIIPLKVATDATNNKKG